jgi:hypothetical protein
MPILIATMGDEPKPWSVVHIIVLDYPPNDLPVAEHVVIVIVPFAGRPGG